MITVCVPKPADRAGIDPLPSGVRVLVWDGEGAPPDGTADTEFLVRGNQAGPLSDAESAALPNLKVIQLQTAGVDRWSGRVPDGVTLCNARGVHGGSTAELAVAGILSLLRRLPFFLEQQTAARWVDATSDDLDGKGLLVLGAGDIGRRIAASLEVFGAKATFVGRTARDDIRGIDELDELLPNADVVVISLPLTAQTEQLVDAGFLAALPDGAIVVNISRGPIVDQDALLAELSTQRLQAFLDVADPEPLPADHPLWHAPNLLITPHVGGGTTGWQRRSYRLIREQLGRYAAGQSLENVVSGDY